MLVWRVETAPYPSLLLPVLVSLSISLSPSPDKQARDCAASSPHGKSYKNLVGPGQTSSAATPAQRREQTLWYFNEGNEFSTTATYRQQESTFMAVTVNCTIRIMREPFWPPFVLRSTIIFKSNKMLVTLPLCIINVANYQNLRPLKILSANATIHSNCQQKLWLHIGQPWTEKFTN